MLWQKYLYTITGLKVTAAAKRRLLTIYSHKAGIQYKLGQGEAEAK